MAAVPFETELTAPAAKPDWRERRSAIALAALGAIFLATVCCSLFLGRYPLSLSAWWQALTNVDAAGVSGVVLLQVRLPRIFAGILIGAGLSASGAAYQGLFRNPMVSPDILGVSAGAGLGAAAGILLGLDIIAIQLLSFGGGLVAVVLTCVLAAPISRRGDPVLTLVLVGILVGSVFSSLISLVKYVADVNTKLPAITFWLMGSLAAITPRDVRLLAPITVVGLAPLLAVRWRLNVLSFGEEEARALGVNTRRLRWTIILSATLLTASSVAVAGMVGWVGLVIPHLARMLVGPNYKVLLPASLLIGSTYLLLVDDIARSVYATEIPLGILTAFAGAPFFLYLMTRSNRGWV